MTGAGPDRFLAPSPGTPPPSASALHLTVWYDYHCPYSHRAVEWLLGLGPRLVRPRFRPFALEQVNRDPSATTWRLWDQPLDYVHYRERQDRRALQSFLATLLLEGREPAVVVDRFRLAVYEARFEAEADISDLEFLRHLAGSAGADAERLARDFASEAALAPAREALARAWSDARSEYEIFGVPTLELNGASPFYLRLERAVEAGPEAVGLLGRLLDLRSADPFVLEVKVPERIGE